MPTEDITGLKINMAEVKTELKNISKGQDDLKTSMDDFIKESRMERIADRKVLDEYKKEARSLFATKKFESVFITVMIGVMVAVLTYAITHFF